MNKRLSIFTILLALIITTAACGKTENKSNNSTSEVTTEVSASEILTTEPTTVETTETTTVDTTTSEENSTAESTDETSSTEAATSNTTETTTTITEESTSSKNNTSTNKDKNNNKNNNSNNKNNNNNNGTGNTVGEKDSSKLTQSNTTSSSSEEKTLAQNIVNQIITNNMSEFEKAKTIHDYIIMNVDYDYANYLNDTIPSQSYTALGVLKYKTAVCAGYAKAFQLICQLAGLECTYIVGDTPRGAHAWNQIKIDGKWYNTDVTWDDPISLEKDFNDHRYNNYGYFLISDEIMYKDHTPKSKVQTCSSSLMEKAYEVGGAWQASTYTRVTTENELRAVIKKAVDADSTSISVMFDTNWQGVQDMQSMVSGLLLEFVARDYSLSGSYFNLKNSSYVNITFTVNLQNGKYTKQNRINTVDELKAFVQSLTTGLSQKTVAISNDLASDDVFYQVAVWAFDTFDVSLSISKNEFYVSSEATPYHIFACENTYHGSHHANEAYRAKNTSDIITILSEHYTDYQSFRVVYRYGDEIGRLSSDEVKAYVDKNLAPIWNEKYCFKNYTIDVDDFVCVMVIKFNPANHNMTGTNWEDSPAATCIKGGTQIIKCVDCHNITNTRDTEPTGVHDTYWVADTDINKHLECKNCTFKGPKLQLYGQVWGYFDDEYATEFFNDVNKLRATKAYIEYGYNGEFIASHDLPQLIWDSDTANTLRTYAVCLAYGSINGETTQTLDNSACFFTDRTSYKVTAEAFFSSFKYLELLKNINFTKASTVHFYYDSDGTGQKIKQITCIVFSE